MKNMNSAFFLRKEDEKPRWLEIDAKGQVLGRLATRIANILRGKHKAEYTPHSDAGDFVIVINAHEVVLTGNKWDTKIYSSYSGWQGGQKNITAREKLAKHPTELIELAVRRMLPKSRLSRRQMTKLKIYASPFHPHFAQMNQKYK